jgi:hypothetical protein
MNIVLDLYSFFSQISAFIVFTIIFAHVVCILWPKKNLKIGSDSLVIITGGCMGIGKQMALELAKKYHPTLLIIDRRDDLFDGVRK